MISVGSRDGRKGIESSENHHKNKKYFNNFSGHNMDEFELEEGEACSYHDDDDEEPRRIDDVDVALSYLDEKLQSVLGHFQKDFEGVVSAENLGAKYGTYGSFLPAHRRSPIQSHSRSPPRNQNLNTPPSATNLQVEGGCHNSLSQTSVPNSIKHGFVSTGSTSTHVYKPASQNGSCKQTAKTPATQSTPKSDVRDQRTLKVRIKVGSDNVKKNAALYSGLGLEGSPSTSLEDSPMESKGLSRGQPLETQESTAQILEMMTTFPIFEGCLLSPLPEALIELEQKPKTLHASITHCSSKADQAGADIGDQCSSMKDNKLSFNNKGVSWQKRDDRESRAGSVFSLKEAELDTGSCDELVSNALKLPLLSNTHGTTGDSAGHSLKEEVLFDGAEHFEPISDPVILGNNGNWKAISDKNRINDSIPDGLNEIMTSSGKLGISKGEVATSVNAEPLGLKSKKASNGQLKDSVKRLAGNSSTSVNEMGLPNGEEELSSRDKRKIRKSKVHNSSGGKAETVTAKDSRKMRKDQKRANIEASLFANDVEKLPPKEDLSKAHDTYKDFFGEFNEQEADILASPDMLAENALKTSDIVEKATVNKNSSRERNGSLGTNKASIVGADLDASLHKPSLSGNNKPIPEAAPAGDYKDNWVCCDICHKWRLVPLASTYDGLSDQWWDCSMMTWLPGMNVCGISEEQSNEAFRTRYQLPVENSTNLHVPLVGVPTRMVAADALDLVPNCGKMVDRIRKASKSSVKDSPNQLSVPAKKQQSVKERTSGAPKMSTVDDGLEFQQPPKASDSYVGRNKRSKSDKQRAASDSGGGHNKIAKTKGKRERDQEIPRSSKKSKSQSMREENDRSAANDVGNDVFGAGSGYDLEMNTARKDKMTGVGSLSLRNVKDEIDGNRIDTFDKLKTHCDAIPGVASQHDKNDITAPKKRKKGNLQDPSSCTPSLGKSAPASEQSSRKKYRVSKSEGKESSSSKRNGRSDKRSKSISQHGVDDVKSLQKDLSCEQPVVAATSSSSKVSGSLKVKSKFHDLKASPVESVSSFPLRTSNSEKLKSGSKITEEKDRKDISVAAGQYESVEPSRHLHSLPVNGCADILDAKAQTSDRHLSHTTRGEGGDDDLNNIVIRKGKSSKDSSSLAKDMGRALISESEDVKVKVPVSYENPQDSKPVFQEREKERKIKIEQTIVKKSEDGICNDENASFVKSKVQLEDEKRSSKKFEGEKSESSARQTSENHLALDGDKNDILKDPRPPQTNGSADARLSDLPKDSKPDKKVDVQNGSHRVPSKHPISNGHRVMSQEARSPLRRDSSSQSANNTLKEAKNLKHLADRLKSGGSAESTGLYFEAALKFLHSASLLESAKTENGKHSDIGLSMDIYSSTAKLCGFCAHEFEKSKDMAAAALAYKCMEVAYMRVIYSSHRSASRDQHELQTVLQMVPPGESPSSSASDIDNLNNSVTGDKAPQVRSGNSPQIAANLVISARNRPNFSRLLNFAQEVNLAMEASRKSRVAFAAVNTSINQEELKDVISSIKRALDFNFHDVEGLLRLVRLAKEGTIR